MSGNFYNEPKREDCPNCGAEEGAMMGSTEWGHNFTCCGNSCGMELKEKLDANESTPEYAAAIVELEQAREKARELRFKDLEVDSEPFDTRF